MRTLSMRIFYRIALLLLLFVLVGCGDGEFSLRFRLPEPVSGVDVQYRDIVDTIELRIYQPSQGTVSCDDIAFGLVTEESLRVSLAGEYTLRAAQSVPLEDVDRNADKLFVAHAIDADGNRILSGCAFEAEISDASDIDIPVEATVTVQAIDEDANGDTSSFRMFDAIGNVLVGVQGRWELVTTEGVVGEGMAQSADCDVGVNPFDCGVMTVTAAKPDKAGPFFLRLRVRWADEMQLGGNAAVSSGLGAAGIVMPTPITRSFVGRIETLRAGRIGPNGEAGFVGVSRGGRPQTMYFTGETANPFLVTTNNPVLAGAEGADDQTQLAVVPQDPPARDEILVVTDSSWNYLDENGAVISSVPLVSGDLLPGGAALEPLALTIGEARGSAGGQPCTNDPGRLVFLYYQRFRGFHLLDGSVPFAETQPEIFRAGETNIEHGRGCVSTSQGELIPTIFLVNSGSPFVVYEDLTYNGDAGDDVVEAYFLSGLGSSMSFSPPNTGERQILAGPVIKISEFVVSAFWWNRIAASGAERADGQTLQVATEELHTLPSVAEDISTKSGDFDGDGRLDVVTLYRGADGNGGRTYFLTAAFAALDSTRRLVASLDLRVSPSSQAALEVVDVEGDGIDDIIVGETFPGDTVNANEQSDLLIYLMGRINR